MTGEAELAFFQAPMMERAATLLVRSFRAPLELALEQPRLRGFTVLACW